jgi:2-isopropylmalate synthase
VNSIDIVDITLRISEQTAASGLSFKEKLELAKLLEKLHVDVIETGYVGDAPADKVIVAAIADTVSRSIVSVPVGIDRDAIARAAEAVSRAKRPRINLVAPTSAVQMEYAYQVKPEALLQTCRELVGYCTSLCPDVEFTAEDATRSEYDFLVKVLAAALEQGAKTITLCDSAGLLLPGETAALVQNLLRDVPGLASAKLTLQCKDDLGLATANAIAAIGAGAMALKTTFNGMGACLSMEQFAHALTQREDALNAGCGLRITELQRGCKQMEALLGMNRTGRSAFSRVVGTAVAEDKLNQEGIAAGADLFTVRHKVESLGYDLEDEDMNRVYQRVLQLSEKKRVDNRDLEALVAELTRHVTPTYQLVNYVINSGQSITATACIQLDKQGEPLQAVSIGDGPIDAAFLAIEQMVGHHIELDDFQIQAVTEGREAMGDALVKLRSNGKLYPGHGLSTDIIGASIKAYLHALNKIVYEERMV